MKLLRGEKQRNGAHYRGQEGEGERMKDVGTPNKGKLGGGTARNYKTSSPHSASSILTLFCFINFSGSLEPCGAFRPKLA